MAKIRVNGVLVGQGGLIDGCGAKVSANYTKVTVMEEISSVSTNIITVICAAG